MFAPHAADFPFRPMLFPVPAKVTVAALIWVYIFCKLRTEFPFIVKLPSCKRVEEVDVPVATVLLKVARLPAAPPKVRAPCVPESGSRELADKVPPAPIETVPLFFTVFTIAALAMFSVELLALLMVTTEVPSASEFLACKVPPEMVVVPV